MNNRYIPYIFFSLLLIAACSGTTKIQKRLADTWTISHYIEHNIDGNDISTRNAGTITFRSNGTGTKNISFRMMSTDYSDNNNFTWKANDNFVIISSDNSILSKSWIITKNEPDLQYWKSTDGKGNVQEMELTK